MLCINSRNGKLWRTSQIKFGRKIRSEQRAPSQIQALERKRRCGVRSSAMKTAIAKNVPRNPGDEGDERRLIDVAGAEMLGAREVVQLVAKNSVTARGAEMEEHLGDRQQDHDCRSARKTIGASAISARNVKSLLHS